MSLRKPHDERPEGAEPVTFALGEFQGRALCVRASTAHFMLEHRVSSIRPGDLMREALGLAGGGEGELSRTLFDFIGTIKDQDANLSFDNDEWFPNCTYQTIYNMHKHTEIYK